MTRNFARPGRSPVYAHHHAAATSHPLATNSALTILREGGNAVDAALAASATLCVVEPHMTGIGGDCFAIVAEPDATLHGLNASGRSSRHAELGWYLDNGFGEIPATSPHAITAPGALRGWEALHNRFGSMDFARLFSDAIHYARNGFPVAPRVAADWKDLVAKLSGNETSASILLRRGKPPVVGESWQFPKLASTLEHVAMSGVEDFYCGGIAEEIAETVTGLGGFLDAEDLAGTMAEWVDPVSTPYGDHLLHELPPNGQGIIALMIVNLLSKIGVPTEPDSVKRAHLEAELGRIAYAARDAFLADPEHMPGGHAPLLSGGFTDSLADQFDPLKRNNEIEIPDPIGSDTVYLSVVDRDGLAVSFINSVFSGFGSAIATPKSGIVLQNRGSGFNLIKGHPNAIGAGKRPLHTIIPAMVTHNGRVSHSFGVMGGAYQAMGHAHVLSNMLDYRMDPQAALDHPRIFWDDKGDLLLEDGVLHGVRQGLSDLGHACHGGAVHGGGQIIAIDNRSGTLIAGSDPRKDGCAGGY